MVSKWSEKYRKVSVTAETVDMATVIAGDYGTVPRVIAALVAREYARITGKSAEVEALADTPAQ